MNHAKPDAILYSEQLKTGGNIRERVRNIQTQLGPRLGGDQFTTLGPNAGGRVYSRDVGGGWYLATLRPDDTLNYPNDHELAKQPRYKWEEQPDGTRHGYLLEKAEGPTLEPVEA